MDKVLVNVFAPVIEETFEVWLPLNKKIGDVILLLSKSINELTGGAYAPAEMPGLYDKKTAIQLDVNISVREAEIKNSSELILI